ncbi:MAG: GTPase domain-containing protein, partial [Phycisphaerae bacterium]
SKAVERWRADAAAACFHLGQPVWDRPATAVLGGTGTGKSTLVNRLLGAEISATSYRRTFTGGPVAVVAGSEALPDGWLGLPRRLAAADELPVRGRAGELTLVALDQALTRRLVLVDTPDLDGDQPAHLAEADRAFRWAQAVVFLVTPEKYQMTELLPYYRLARRYALPALFVMNKCETSAVLDDYRALLARHEWPDARVFALPRDDAGYEPPPEAGPQALREALSAPVPPTSKNLYAGLARRCADLMDRLTDQVLEPLREDRRRADRLGEALQALRAPGGGVDVGPLTRQLQRRMQEQSVLYLMGPGRVLERVRRLPGLLARLPKTAWRYAVGGQPAGPPSAVPSTPESLPDFAGILADQFVIVQSRIDDLLRSDPAAADRLEARAAGYAAVRLDPREAARIAEEELADLKTWLEQHWDSAPRDTRLLERLLGRLPGGSHLTRWSEAAPYLLVMVVAAHGAVFGPIDLLVIGGWSLATWMGEKLSNEVAARTRQANRRIAERFEQLVHEQIDAVAAWLDGQAVRAEALGGLQKLADAVSEEIAAGT